MVQLVAKKWNLTYRAILTLTVETHPNNGMTEDKRLLISDPIFCEFDVNRDIDSTINTGYFKFHNLSNYTSSLINQDQFVYMKQGREQGRILNVSRIDFYAFYLGDKSGKYALAKMRPTKLYDSAATLEEIIKESGIEVEDLDNNLIFTGVITEANTYRSEGSTDVITEVISDDRFLELGLSTKVVPAGAERKATILSLAHEAGITKVNIGDFQGSFPNPWILDKGAFAMIDEMTGGLAFCDLGTLNVLKMDETLANRFAYIELNSKTGLLGTPRRTWGQLDGEIIFSPEIKLAMRVILDSQIDTRWNGTYKVLGLRHTGSIGAGSANRANTSVTLLTTPLAYLSSQLLTGEYVNEEGEVTPPAEEPITTTKETQQEEKAPGIKATVSGEKVSKMTVAGMDVYSIISYIKKNHKAPDTYITSEIKWSQAIDKPNCTGEQLPTAGELANLVRVCRIVQSIRDKHFKNGSFRVSSGWRSKKNNASLKGSVANSTHLKGYAVDFHLSAYKNTNVANFILKNYKGWAYAMMGNGGVHYDTNQRIAKGGRTIAQPIAGWSDL